MRPLLGHLLRSRLVSITALAMLLPLLPLREASSATMLWVDGQSDILRSVGEQCTLTVTATPEEAAWDGFAILWEGYGRLELLSGSGQVVPPSGHVSELPIQELAELSSGVQVLAVAPGTTDIQVVFGIQSGEAFNRLFRLWCG